MSDVGVRHYNRLNFPGGASPVVIDATAANQTKTLVPAETMVWVKHSGSYTTTITMPNAAECPGVIFTIILINAGSGAVTVNGPGNGSATDYSINTIDAEGDTVTIQSTGDRYIALASTIA